MIESSIDSSLRASHSALNDKKMTATALVAQNTINQSTQNRFNKNVISDSIESNDFRTNSTEIKERLKAIQKAKSTNVNIQDLDSFLSFPNYIQIETISLCNARCAMCGIEEWKRENHKMSDELFLKIADECINNADKISRISPFMGGECLMDKQIAARIKYLKDNGIKEVFITSNGSLMDKKIAEKILDSRLDQVDFSIDSLNPQIYEKIRVNLKFETTINNVLNFIKMRNDGSFKTRVRIRATQMSNNENEVPQMEKFWSEHLNLLKGDKFYAKRFNTNFMAKTDDKERKEFVGFSKYNFSSNYADDIPCPALWNTAVILSDGRVAMCCVDMGKNVIFGDLKKQSLASVWQNSEILLKARKRHLEQGRVSMGVCKGCDTWI